jgi:hypothetical protein
MSLSKSQSASSFSSVSYLLHQVYALTIGQFSLSVQGESFFMYCRAEEKPGCCYVRGYVLK